MKHDVAMEWAEALESGEYEQGQGLLCQDGKHCCLGVLCEILAVPKRRWGLLGVLFGESQVSSLLPVEAMELSGVGSIAGRLEGRSGGVTADLFHDSLASMNDRGESFASIAAVIREHWAAL